MFGYVAPIPGMLSAEDTIRYKSLYCGLCHTLNRKYGLFARMTLTYDMTFLVLFLSAFYAPEEKTGYLRCGLHPIKKRVYAENCFTEYAADMTIALIYHKCLDDWVDEKKITMKTVSSILRHSYEKVKDLHPVITAKIEEEMMNLQMLEKKKADADAISACFGRLLGSIFVHKKTVWSASMFQFGYNLGKFIYLVDAVLDEEADRKKGIYNPMQALPLSQKEKTNVLTVLIGNATAIFEKMPFVEDEGLIRHILYHGVWQKYYKKFKGETDGKRSV
ncbi:MAG: DUF5685 family protein [Clostridia bacterium]|nr:DUF5685 family protein [Clostridia bacterium]